MTVKMILAVDHGNSIGWSDGRLPWKIPADMARFKALTTGHDVFMGRKTFESFKRPNGLPNRRNIVLSRDDFDGALTVESTKSWDWVRAHQECLGCTPPDLWIIGGAQIYQQAIEQKLVDEIYLTQVHALSGADVLLPFDLWDWKLFVIRESARGVNWEVNGEPEFPPVPLEGPKISFIHFKKTK